jgi:hypothetical protein
LVTGIKLYRKGTKGITLMITIITQMLIDSQSAKNQIVNEVYVKKASINAAIIAA